MIQLSPEAKAALEDKSPLRGGLKYSPGGYQSSSPGFVSTRGDGPVFQAAIFKPERKPDWSWQPPKRK